MNFLWVVISLLPFAILADPELNADQRKKHPRGNLFALKQQTIQQLESRHLQLTQQHLRECKTMNAASWKVL